MKIVLDTNVLISGILFSGPPARILRAWRRDRFQLVLTEEILDEYLRVAAILQEKYPTIDIESPIRLIAQHCEIVVADELPEDVCTDPDDDKFLACAVAAGSTLVVSGDKALQKASGYRGLQVISPRQFVDKIGKEDKS